VGRAKKNGIKHLRKDDGQITKERNEMENMTREIFQHLYRADPNVWPQELLLLTKPKITQDMNIDLCKEFSAYEVGDAPVSNRAT
jgi:hypothetical protein